MKRTPILLTAGALAALMTAGLLTGCGGSGKNGSSGDDNKLYVYNWGEYIDESVIEQFEEETGISVIYDLFETNEEMYPIIEAGAINYDVVCPSDYMIQKMRENDLLAEINFDNVPNVSQIDPAYMEMSKAFDPENKYSVPYLWGTVGILYNKKMVDEPVDSWNILWDEKYTDSILMQDSVRDAFAVALKSLGYSLNSTDLDELEAAKKLLIKQKPLVYAYYVDETSDEIAAGNAAMALAYSGEAATAMELNDDLSYTVPKEGSNLWIDSWFIPKSCKNQENAEKFLDFLCREDVAMKNFDYVCYATPNLAVIDALDDETLSDTTIFPPQETLDNCTVYKQFDESTTSLYSYLWKKLKSE